MTDHLHSTFVDGCYRCDLSRDEVTGQRVSDEQFAEWLRQRGESWNVGMLAFDAVAADLRAVREENQRLRDLLTQGWDFVNRLERERDNLRQANMGYVANLIDAGRLTLGGGSSD